MLKKVKAYTKRVLKDWLEVPEWETIQAAIDAKEAKLRALESKVEKKYTQMNRVYAEVQKIAAETTIAVAQAGSVAWELKQTYEQLLAEQKGNDGPQTVS